MTWTAPATPGSGEARARHPLCQVWWVKPDQVPPEHVRLLDDTERHRASTIIHPAARRRFTVATAVLKTIAARHIGLAPAQVRIRRTCPECDRPHGRPYVLDADIDVSISHSGDRVAVA